MSETGKKSMLCPNCRKLISSDEPLCPYCGIANPGSSWKRYMSGGMSGGPADMISIILYTNVVFYILSIFLNPRGIGLAPNPFTFLAPSDQSLFLLGATGSYPVFYFHRWWTLISASFLHGGILHIFFNMAALRQLGPFVVREYGSSRFIIIYVLSGVAGFAFSTLAGVPLTIGASASLCGLIGAILYYGKSRGGFYGQAVYKQATGWVIGLIIFGLLFPGINNWAHGGGIAAGALVGFLAGYKERKEENMRHKTLATACTVATVLVLIWALLQAFYYRFI